MGQRERIWVYLLQEGADSYIRLRLGHFTKSQKTRSKQQNKKNIMKEPEAWIFMQEFQTIYSESICD